MKKYLRYHNKTVLLFVTTIISAAVFLLSCTDEGAWDLLQKQIEIENELTDWNKRIKITIDNSAQSQTLSDFPVLVKLNAANISYSDFKADGSDITFYTSSLDDRLDYEIDTWNTSGDSFIWVKIPSISGNSDTEYFWMYYSSAVNTGIQDPDSVWSDNYRAVFHLDETGTTYADSSPYRNNAAGGTNGQTDPGNLADDKIGGVQVLDLVTDSIAVPADSSINNLGPFTYSFWVYNSGSDGDRLLSKDKFELWISLNTRIRVEVSYTDGIMQKEFDCMPSGVWTYIAITWSGAMNTADIILYKNGASAAHGSTGNTSGSRESDAASDLFIGNDTYNGANNSKDCRLDEFRISGKVRSDDWINAQYLSQTDAFLTYSATEDL